MKLLLTVRQGGSSTVDVSVTVDAGATVGDVAGAFLTGSGERPKVSSPTLVVVGDRGHERTLDPNLPVTEAPIASGDQVAVGEAPSKSGGSGLQLKLLGGPDAGRRIPLRVGLNSLGRDPSSTIVLTDPMVSKHHAKIIVGESVEIIDDNSANGVLSAGIIVQRFVVADGDQFTVGDTVVAIEGTSKRPEVVGGSPGTIAFNRSPRLDPTFEGKELVAPEPPEPQRAQRVPLITALVPLLMGGALFAITKSIESVVFVALSPLMLVGGYFENRRVAKRTFREEVEVFEQNLAELVAELRVAQDEERAARRREHPSTEEVVDAVRAMAPLTWTRRPEHERFLSLRLGLGTQPSRISVELPKSRKGPVELRRQLEESVKPFETLDNVPVVCALPVGGSLGVSGPADEREGVAAGLVAQLVGLHSPAEVSVVAIASVASAPRWEWLKWLPHVESEHAPIGGRALVSSAGSVASLIADLSALIDTRNEGPDGESSLPAVVVLVEDDAPLVRSAMIEIAERGAVVGVHVLWMADTTALLPAVCRTFLELEPRAFGAATGKVIEGERVEPVIIESLDRKGANWLGKRLAPVVDSGVGADSQSDVPTSVSYLAEAGIELADDPSAVIDRWMESNSVRVAGEPTKRLRRDNTLRALVGRSGVESLHLDLRSQGPHALVGGTTGAGKSEFLQTWVLAMAAAHSPQRVTFLFVDYKGGAAFSECIALPHSVGLVTDLSPHLVQRALRSLNAELRYREHILNRKRAKDLLELERRQDPEAPPSLVIVVDEFAALVQEVPDFVDGVVNVAQRGRSLGLHLILATQRPAGVIKGNLRANTNLRVALRMADGDDSTDVIGTSQAAGFDPGIPGRGIAKTGPGRLTLFQSGYVGGVTSAANFKGKVAIQTLVFGEAAPWETEPGDDEGQAPSDDARPDIERIVQCIGAASKRAGLEAPRKPWLPELAEVYDLAVLPTNRTDAELVFGVIDKPDDQSQGTLAFRPDTDGSMVVLGTGGSGKSAALRSLAAAAGLTARGGPCQVFGLDFGSRGLSMIEVMPHVGSVITGDDLERTARLFRHLRAVVDDRAERFAKVNAGSIAEFRKLAGAPEEARILLLLDGYGAFRTAFEIGPYAWLNEALQTLATDGRPLGIHVIMSADRPGVVPPSLASAIQKRLVLRLANENDILMAGVPKGGFGENTPPGRGFLEGEEVQVALLGGKVDATDQARSMEKLAGSMSRARATPTPPIGTLPEIVLLDELPALVDRQPAFALGDEALAPFGFEPTGCLLVAGPSGSGKSTAVLTLLQALRRSDDDVRVAYIGHRRSPLASRSDWTQAAVGAEEAAQLAQALGAELRDHGSRPPVAVLVIDGLGEILNTEADFPVQELLKACKAAGVFVIAEGETSDLGGSWPLLQAVRAPRHGLVLQPDQMDGDNLFKTSLARMSRADFPVGRGMYVRQGRAHRVQVAMPI